MPDTIINGRPTQLTLALESPLAAPSVAAVHALHRHDGLIYLARISGDTFTPLGAVSNKEPWLPVVLDAVSRDGYMGVNPVRTFRARGWQPVEALPVGHELAGLARDFPGAQVATDSGPWPRRAPATGLVLTERKRIDILALSACWADCDCYKLGLSFADAVAQVLDAERDGRIPRSTVIADSGRGLWVYYFLRDERDPLRSPDFDGRTAPLFDRIQRRLAQVFAPLGADAGACDVTRLTPLPGTLKSNSGRRVDWKLHSFNPPVYTLAQLAQAFAVDALPELEQQRRRRALPPVVAINKPRDQRDPAKVRAGRAGYAARLRRPLDDLLRLIEHRGGGFAKGCRTLGAFHFADLLLKVRSVDGAPLDQHAAWQRVLVYGAKCAPPLPLATMRKAFNQARRQRHGRTHSAAYAVLWQRLLVTPNEARAANLQTFFRVPPAPKKQRTRERRAAIRARIAAAAGFVPTVRTMAADLRALGFRVAAVTVARDYHALGFRDPQATLADLRD